MKCDCQTFWCYYFEISTVTEFYPKDTTVFKKKLGAQYCYNYNLVNAHVQRLYNRNFDEAHKKSQTISLNEGYTHM